jgi:hypothetical protein
MVNFLLIGAGMLAFPEIGELLNEFLIIAHN